MKGPWLVLILSAAVGACDAKATASDPQGARADMKSREYESCGASLHCLDDLRCFDNVCRRTARSAVGDYWSAFGAAARGRGEVEEAIAAYAQAIGSYEQEKLAVPPEIDCAYGATLAAAKAKKQHAELAARVLHRCVLAVPAGSSLRDQAFAQLATLADVGLDPVLLGGGKTADLYLTKAPKGPALDKLAVTVQPSPQPSAKSFPQLVEKLTAPESRTPLVMCWDAYNKATKKETLTVTMGVKSSYVAPEYDDEYGAYKVKLDQPAGLAGPEAAADACVRQVVDAIIAGGKFTDSFNTRLAITIK